MQVVGNLSLVSTQSMMQTLNPNGPACHATISGCACVDSSVTSVRKLPKCPPDAYAIVTGSTSTVALPTPWTCIPREKQAMVAGHAQ